MNPRVKKVVPEPGYKLRLFFTNGEQRVFDVKPHLSKGVFRKLKSVSAFRSVRAVLGSVQWGGGQDLCPDMLYEDSRPLPAGGAGMVCERRPRYRAGPTRNKHSRK